MKFDTAVNGHACYLSVKISYENNDSLYYQDPRFHQPIY